MLRAYENTADNARKTTEQASKEYSRSAKFVREMEALLLSGRQAANQPGEEPCAYIWLLELAAFWGRPGDTF